MWRILLVLSIWYMVLSTTMCVENNQPLWPMLEEIEHNREQLDEDLYKAAYSYASSTNKFNKDIKDDFEEFQLPPNESKRGFSLLARWKPFNNIGKNRASIREHNTKMKLLDQDVVMETRAHSRPAGQPLRWGK